MAEALRCSPAPARRGSSRGSLLCTKVERTGSHPSAASTGKLHLGEEWRSSFSALIELASVLRICKMGGGGVSQPQLGLAKLILSLSLLLGVLLVVWTAP